MATERIDGLVPENAALALTEYCRKCNDLGQDKPADFILWGKSFPSEALGPRCYIHAEKHIGSRGMSQLDQWAVYDLRPARNLAESASKEIAYLTKVRDSYRASAGRTPPYAFALVKAWASCGPLDLSGADVPPDLRAAVQEVLTAREAAERDENER